MVLVCGRAVVRVVAARKESTVGFHEKQTKVSVSTFWINIDRGIGRMGELSSSNGRRRAKRSNDRYIGIGEE